MRLSIAVGSLILLVPAVAPAAYATAPGCSTRTPALDETVTCTTPPGGETITVPNGAQTLTATVLGAGGGGGGASSGGTGGPGARGARVTATFDVTGVSAIQVYLGAGGLAGSGSANPPANGGAGDQSRIVAGLVDLIIAGGGGGGGAGNGSVGGPGTTATASVALGATSSSIQLTSGSLGGGGGVSQSCSPSNGLAGANGTVTFTFYGANTSAPSNDEAATPSAAPMEVRSFLWRGPGSGSTTGTFTEGTWQNTPSATEWTLPGQTLLGWATDPQFPVSIAQRATGAYDGVIDGRRMIFIPAGKPTFVSGDASLHAIWAPANRTQLIGRC